MMDKVQKPNNPKCYEGCSNETHLTITGPLKKELKDK
jgi:hypothetical protein